MEENSDYRLYLEQKFKGIHEVLERIEEQTIKTNGRVTVLEKNELQHVIDCPVKKDLDLLSNDLTEYRIIKKYPKLSLILIALTCISMIGATIYSINHLTAQVKKIEAIEVTK